MDMLDLVPAQLMDPFRIGLLIALVATTYRTAAQTGYAIPLVLGAAFIAVLIPSTTTTPVASTTAAIGAGIVSNVIILAVLLALLALWTRLTATKTD